MNRQYRASLNARNRIADAKNDRAQLGQYGGAERWAAERKEAEARLRSEGWIDTRWTGVDDFARREWFGLKTFFGAPSGRDQRIDEEADRGRAAGRGIPNAEPNRDMIPGAPPGARIPRAQPLTDSPPTVNELKEQKELQKQILSELRKANQHTQRQAARHPPIDSHRRVDPIR
jgi:hypothetical protein